jgi:hypothetical protein
MQGVSAGLSLLLIPAGGLLVLFGAGLGAADLLGGRFAPPARAALAAPLAAGVLACASPLEQVGLRPPELALVSLGPLALLSALRGRRLAATLRASGLPALVAVVAIVLSGIPSLGNGTWAAGMDGNGDPYYWVSQARAFVDGPVPEPASAYPDRLAYDLISSQRWPVAVPDGLAELASLDRADPVDVYEAYAAVVYALLALGAVFVARAALGWSARLSAVAGAAVALNASLLFASYYGWQAQLALTTFGLLCALSLVSCFDAAARPRERVLPALFAAAGIATYGWLFGVFAALAGVLTLGYLLGVRWGRDALGRVAATLCWVVALTLAFGAFPCLQAVRSYLQSHGRWQASVVRAWASENWEFPSNALGLVPVTLQRPSPAPGLVVAAALLSIVLIALAVLRARACGGASEVALACGGAALLVGLVGVYLSGAGPHFSTKLMGYGAPFLTLLALSLFARRRLRSLSLPLAALCALAAAFFVISAGVSIADGVENTLPATTYRGLTQAAARLPPGAAVRVEAASWEQVWLVYFLRDRRLALPQPTLYFSASAGYAEPSLRPLHFDAAARYVLRTKSGGGELWTGSGLALYRLPAAR